MITLKVGQKGEIVIPKKIREALGIVERSTVKAKLREKTLEINPPEEDIIAKMEEMAKRYNVPASEIEKMNRYEEFDVY